MTEKSRADIITRDAAAVIGYSDIVDSAVAYLHGYGAAACIESVFNKLLNDACRAFNNLAGSNFVSRIRFKYNNSFIHAA